MALQPVLWGNNLCPYVQRARIVLAMAGKEYAFKLIDLHKKPKEFNEVSPYGKIPVMQVEEGTIWESAAINQYVDEKWANSKIMGTDPYKRAMHRVWTHWCNTRASTAIYNALFNQDRSKDEQLLKNVDETLKFLETRLPAMQGKGPFMMGSEYQFSDIMVTPFLQRLPVLAHYRGYVPPCSNKLPLIARLTDACEQELKAHPVHHGHMLTTEQLIKGYEPYANGKIPVDGNAWGY